jgi:hypothetical protein
MRVFFLIPSALTRCLFGKHLYFFSYPMNLARLISQSVQGMVFVNLLVSVGLLCAAHNTHLSIQNIQSYHVLPHYRAMYTVHDTHT